MLRSALRLHRTLRLDQSPIRVTREGYWIVQGVATVSGVYEYRNADGTIRREYRSADEVERSAETLLHQPISIQHEGGELGPSNIAEHRCGTVTRVWVERLEDGRAALCFEARIETDEGQRAIASGLWYLSAAYHFAEIDQSGGVAPDGTHFDLAGSGIIYNHLTLTDRPRVGHEAQLRLDSTDWHETREIRTMKTVTVKFQNRTFKVGALAAVGLRHAVKHASALRTDAIDVRTISIEDEQGTMVELTVPAATVDEILAMLGAGSSTSSSTESEPAAEAPAADGTDPMPVPVQDTAPPAQQAPRMDTAIETMVARVVRQELGRVERNIGAAQAERRSIEREAAQVLGPRFDFANTSTPDVLAATVAKIRGAEHEDTAAAAKLAKAWRQDSLTDERRFRALGKLEALYESAIAAIPKRGQHTSGPVELLHVLREDAKTKAADPKKPDTSLEAGRQAMIARMTGKTSKTTAPAA
ncbi:MAG: DUF2213 domain-containing protein [Myxococcales bacterium]|nr:DUF2213 domain-containing protein [Myxococcales bacterium]